MNVRSHVLINAAISPYRKGKIPFITSLADNSVTLLNKGFFSTDLLVRIQNGGVTPPHWLIPQRKGLVYTELEHYGD